MLSDIPLDLFLQCIVPWLGHEGLVLRKLDRHHRDWVQLRQQLPWDVPHLANLPDWIHHVGRVKQHQTFTPNPRVRSIEDLDLASHWELLALRQWHRLQRLDRVWVSHAHASDLPWLNTWQVRDLGLFRSRRVTTRDFDQFCRAAPQLRSLKLYYMPHLELTPGGLPANLTSLSIVQSLGIHVGPGMLPERLRELTLHRVTLAPKFGSALPGSLVHLDLIECHALTLQGMACPRLTHVHLRHHGHLDLDPLLTGAPNVQQLHLGLFGPVTMVDPLPWTQLDHFQLEHGSQMADGITRAILQAASHSRVLDARGLSLANWSLVPFPRLESLTLNWDQSWPTEIRGHPSLREFHIHHSAQAFMSRAKVAEWCGLELRHVVFY